MESECVGGKIGSVTILSDLGRRLKVRCPYDGPMEVSVNGKKLEGAARGLFELDTAPGDEITLNPVRE